MSINIAIQEGGAAKQLTVEKLKTNLVGGGTCLWVPEDGVELGTKRIEANGTFAASSDGYYGFSSVTVDVPGGAGSSKPGGKGSAVVGKKNGEDTCVKVDNSGNVTERILPQSIVITHEPLLTYHDGDSIDFSTMEVRAYTNSGLWNDASYPNGIIPLNELTLPVTQADINLGEIIYSNGGGAQSLIRALLVTYTEHWYVIGGRDYQSFYSDQILGYYGNYPCTLGTTEKEMANILVTRYNGHVYAARIRGNSAFNIFTPRGSGGEWVSTGTTTYTTRQGSFTDAFWDEYLTLLPESTTDPTNVAISALSPEECIQTIPVKWTRPEDGKVLETSFDITVYANT